MEDRDKQEIDDMIAHYIQIGALSIEGIDDDGEFLMSVTDEAKELAPELYDMHKDYVDSLLMDWFEKGLINISYDEDLTAMVEITEAGIETARQYGII